MSTKQARPSVRSSAVTRRAETSAAAPKPHKAQALIKSPGVQRVTLSIDVAPLVEAVGLHVKLTPQQRDGIAQDLSAAFEKLTFRMSTQAQDAVHSHAASIAPAADEILTTEEAAQLVGVSRPFMVKLIDAGNIELHHRVGNQRRVLRSAVMTWQQAERSRQRKALKRLAVGLDDEIFT